MPVDEALVIESSSSSSDSPGDADDACIEFYPAYCYRASPTWFTWVKLTAHDVHHRLQTRRGFQLPPAFIETANGWIQTQNLLLFYLNHPIQFIQLVGVVVTFEDYYEKFWLFTLDDSSGSTVEVHCRKPQKIVADDQETAGQVKIRDTEAEARWETMGKVDIGTIVQVKGRIDTFRDVRQLQLDRISILSDTNQEVRLIKARISFYNQVLSCPWTLTPEKQKTLRDHALGENDGRKDRLRKRQKVLQMRNDREQRHAERIAKQYEREEKKRCEGAEEARRAGQLLKPAI